MKQKSSKLGKRADGLSAKWQAKNISKFGTERTTLQQYYEAAIDDEESGDRWLGSDLSKSLRFYQKAYANYIAAIEARDSDGDSEVEFDCHYNSIRLLFHVYHIFSAEDGVSVEDLTNIEEVLFASPHSVLQPLQYIFESHQQLQSLVQNQGKKPSTDLQFNTILVLIEALEVEHSNPDALFSSATEFGSTAQKLLTNLLESQYLDMKFFVAELTLTECAGPVNSSIGSLTDSSQQEEVTNDESVVQPTDLLETILASYRLITAFIESANTIFEIDIAAVNTSNLFHASNSLADVLITNFSETSEFKNSMVDNISGEQIIELILTRAYTESLSLREFDALVSFWTEPSLPETAERYMLAADSIQNELDRSDVDFTHSKSSVDVANALYTGLSQISQFLKRAQDILEERMKEIQRVFSNTGIGALISQISQVGIYRADIELQRYQIVGPANKNAEVILGNAKVLLKNAMNTANVSGGLRERAVERMVRESKKLGAMSRLCVIEGKTSTHELDTVMGRDRWRRAIPKLAKLDYYEPFGVKEVGF